MMLAVGEWRMSSWSAKHKKLETEYLAESLRGRDVFEAYDEYDNQSIEKSLCSDNMLVRIWAVMDRRVGKRRLISMAAAMSGEHDILKYFYRVRMEAEDLEKYMIAS